MQKLEEQDLQYIVRRLPKPVKEVLVKFPQRVCVGGGFIRSCITGDKVCDIDLFVSDKDLADKVVQHLSLCNNFRKVKKSDNAFTVLLDSTPAIQVIHRWTYASPTDTLDDFDFSICRAVVYTKPFIFQGSKFKYKGFCCDTYYQDLAAKRLRYMAPTRIEESGGSLLRVFKYHKKGYNISMESLAKVIARLVSGVGDATKGDDSIVDGFKDEINMAFVLQGLLREVDPNDAIDDDIPVKNEDLSNE